MAFDHAGRYGADSLTFTSGAPLPPGSIVSVLLPGTSTAAVLYSDRDRTPLGSPATIDVTGNFEFYAEPGDYDLQVNGGPRVRVSAFPDPEDILGGDSSSTWPVHVLDFGADPTGVADSSAAFLAAQAAVWASRVTPDPAGTVTGVLRAGIYVAPGAYRITQPEAVLGPMSGGGNKATGLTIIGAGPNRTQIIYDPEPGDEAGPMMRNTDQFLHVTIRDIEFASLAGGGEFDVRPVFLHSQGSGGTKDIVFQRCRWTGWFDKVMKLTGDNTNAQWSFHQCMGRSFGATNGFLWSDPAASIGGNSAVGSAAPFVNYWFGECSFALKGGHFVNAAGYLGHIHMRDSMVLYEPAATAGTLFRLMKDNLGPNEAQFSVQGCYFELHNNGHMLLESRWQRGSITFRSCNWDSGGPGDFTTASVALDVRNTNKGMPDLLFDGCGMKGIHQFTHDDVSWQGPQRTVRYERCDVQGYAQLSSMIAFVDSTGNGRIGGRPAIEFTDCSRHTGANDWQAVRDQTVGWLEAVSGKPTKRVATFTSMRGDIPRSATDSAGQATRILPVGCRVTAAALRMFTGGGASTNWAFAFTDLDGTVLATIAAEGRQLAGAKHRVAGLDFPITTVNQATITAVGTGTIPTGAVGLLTLEYTA